jgi:hypothetical protein
MGVSLILMLIAFKQLRKSKIKALHYVSSLGPIAACVVGGAAPRRGGCSCAAAAYAALLHERARPGS